MDRPKLYSPSVSDSAAQPRGPQPHDRQPGFSSARQVKLAWVNARSVVDQVCAQLEPRLKAAQIEATIDVPQSVGLVADAEMLRLAVTHLVSNALDAMDPGGRLVFTSYNGPGGFELEVADSGPGLDDDAICHAFEPFYTTKQGAVGLGLPLVRRIAQAHGGDIVAKNCPEGGAAFTLRFPPRAMQSAA